jgi:hypothetical protein
MLRLKTVLFAVGLSAMLACAASAQCGVVTAGTMASGGAPKVFDNNYHIGFERPEARPEVFRFGLAS